MKVAIIGPTDRSIWSFRRGLIKKLIELDTEVDVLCSSGDYVQKIKTLGATHIPINMKRFWGPVEDIRYFLSMYLIFKKNNYDFIHTFTIKPNVMGSVAARLARIRHIYCLVEGLGFSYPEEHGLTSFIMRQICLMLYRITCKIATRIWFINRDDLLLFLKKNIIPPEKAVFIRSVGVDIAEYSPEIITPTEIQLLRLQLNKENPNYRYVIMVSRMIWNKGVKEYIEAASILGKRFMNVRFLLVGEVQKDSPGSISEEFLKEALPQNVIWLNFRADIPQLLAISEILVLPSYYREGVPRVLLEGMAMAKPIVTTDYPGCREVIRDGYNGYVVPIKNPEALACAIERLLSAPEMIKIMGLVGRKWVEAEFDERIVVSRVISELYRL